MKRTTYLLILLGFVFACKPKAEVITPEPEENKCRQLSYKEATGTGLVSANTVYSYNEKKQLIELKDIFQGRTDKYEYNTKGLLIKKTRSNLSDLSKQLEVEYIYNEKDQLIKETRKWLNPSGETATEEKFLFEYHANGKRKKEEYYAPNKAEVYWRYTYDEKGLVIMYEAPLGEVVKYEYKADGKMLKYIYITADKKTTIEDTYEYNAKNLLVKINTTVNNVLGGYRNFKYNSKDQETAWISYDANGVQFQKRTTEYTGDNYVVKNYNSADQLDDQTAYEVVDGKIMKKTFYRKDVEQYVQTYSYDASGNMIRDEYKSSIHSVSVIKEWAYACD
ncbi:hypothetical protein [Emticicia fontis]